MNCRVKVNTWFKYVRLRSLLIAILIININKRLKVTPFWGTRKIHTLRLI